MPDNATLTPPEGTDSGERNFKGEWQWMRPFTYPENAGDVFRYPFRPELADPFILAATIAASLVNENEWWNTINMPITPFTYEKDEETGSVCIYYHPVSDLIIPTIGDF